MARQRKAKATEVQSTTEEINTALPQQSTGTITNTITNTTSTNGGYKMALTQEQINALLAGSRQKGQYVGILNKFLSSGENGIDAAEEYPELKGKAFSTVKQGFENALKSKDAAEGSENVKVIVSGDSDETKRVYLVNLGGATLEHPGDEPPAAE